MSEEDAQNDNPLKEKEIQRLINSNGKKNPIGGILSDEEVLKYAGNSKAAALIRLKNGSNDLSDKWRIHKRRIIVLYVLLFFPTLFMYLVASVVGGFSRVLVFLILLLILIDYPLYFLYIKDYTTDKIDFKIKKEKTTKSTDEPIVSVKNNNIDSFNVYKSQINDLKSLYDVKEKIAKELIEKRFEPPQLTYDKFISSVDNCTELFNNQVDVALNIIDLATEHTSEMDYEIETRINILKSIIEKIDSLTNELVINIGQTQSEENETINGLLDDMENLIESIKEYK